MTMVMMAVVRHAGPRYWNEDVWKSSPRGGQRMGRGKLEMRLTWLPLYSCSWAEGGRSSRHGPTL